MATEINIKEVFLDREEERAIFDEMLRGKRQEHILLIEAEGGMGKTHLLEEFWALAEPYPRCRFDLKSAHNLEQVLFKLCEDLGYEQFGGFYRIVSQVVQGPGTGNVEQKLHKMLTAHFKLDDLRLLCMTLDVDFENLEGSTLDLKALSLIQYMKRHRSYNDLVANVNQARPKLGFTLTETSPPVFSFAVWQQAKTRLSNLNQVERVEYHNQLTGAMIDDLRQLSERAVILFDTFDQERGGREVKEWISQMFLPMARLLPNVVVVVAGRDIPRLGGDSRDWCLRRELRGLDLVHVKEFVERLELTVPDDTISIFYRSTRGRPLLLAQILENWGAGEA